MPTDAPQYVTETRYDRGELLSAQVMPNGTLLVEARVARPGIMPYLRKDGSTQLELISAEQLHNEDSLRTLGRVSTTLEHPPEDVTPRNEKRFGVGDVDGRVNVDGDGFVVIKMAVRRDTAIAAIRKGKREVSPGYKLRLDMTGGIHPEFGRYDAEQLDRVYNHVAITEQARGGPKIRLNVDAVQVLDENRADAAYEIIEHEDPTMDPRLVMLLSLLGVTRVDDEKTAVNEAITNVEKTRKDADEQTRLDAEEEEKFAQLKKDFGDLEKERDQLKGKLEAMEKDKKDTEHEEEEKQDAAERLDLNKIALVHKVDHGDTVDNPTLRRTLAGKILNREIRKDESDDMVRGILAAGGGRNRSPWKTVSTEVARADAATRTDGIRNDDGDPKPADHDKTYNDNADSALRKGRGERA